MNLIEKLGLEKCKAIIDGGKMRINTIAPMLMNITYAMPCLAMSAALT